MAFAFIRFCLNLYSPGPALPRPFAIAGLGFCATPAAGFARLGAATPFGNGLFATAALDFAVLRRAFLGLALTHIFFTALLPADLASNFFSGSSNAGLGTTRSCGPNLLISAAGLTPAAMAVLAAAGLNAARLAVPSKSGFTMIWFSYRKSTDSSLSNW